MWAAGKHFPFLTPSTSRSHSSSSYPLPLQSWNINCILKISGLTPILTRLAINFIGNEQHCHWMQYRCSFKEWIHVCNHLWITLDISCIKERCLFLNVNCVLSIDESSVKELTILLQRMFTLTSVLFLHNKWQQNEHDTHIYDSSLWKYSTHQSCFAMY